MTQSAGGRPSLSERERETLELIAGGMSNREIAETLGLSINTVKTCVRLLYRKVGATSRVQAAHHWQHHHSGDETQGEALLQARRTVSEAMSVIHQTRARSAAEQRWPAPVHDALEDHLRRDLKAGAAVIHDLPDRDLGRLGALLECARAVAASENRPVRLETTFVPHGRVLVRIAMGTSTARSDV